MCVRVSVVCESECVGECVCVALLQVERAQNIRWAPPPPLKVKLI